MVKPPFPGPDGCHFGMQFCLHAKAPHLLLHGPDDIGRMVGRRKDPLAALNLSPNAQSFKEIDDILVAISIETAVQELGIADNR